MPSISATMRTRKRYDVDASPVLSVVKILRDVVRGDPADRRFSIAYDRLGQVVALDGMNATRDDVQGRRLVAVLTAFDDDLLRDASRPLKDYVPSSEGAA